MTVQKIYYGVDIPRNSGTFNGRGLYRPKYRHSPVLLQSAYVSNILILIGTIAKNWLHGKNLQCCNRRNHILSAVDFARKPITD